MLLVMISLYLLFLFTDTIILKSSEVILILQTLFFMIGANTTLQE